MSVIITQPLTLKEFLKLPETEPADLRRHRLILKQTSINVKKVP